MPVWTRIDSHPNLVASYTIDRGRQYELDHTDVGRATVTINDSAGLLDPTNVDGPYWGMIEPLRQAAIARWNPVTDQWYTRFRGFIEGYSYDFDPSQKVNRLTVSLVDIQELLSAIEMLPGEFGIDTSGSADTRGQIGFPIQTMQRRIQALLGDGTGGGWPIDGVAIGAHIPDEFTIIFDAACEVHASIYSPGESVMSAVQEAADAEFPGVANVYVDRLGRLCVHGRRAKFSPEDVDAETDDASVWDWHHWTVGDGAAVSLHPGETAQIRSFAFERGLSKVINIATATPIGMDDTVAGVAAGQVVKDLPSIGKYGYRSWSAQNLITRRDLNDDADDLTATRRFADYYVTNYKQPQDRITEISFRSLRPTDPRAAATWLLLSLIDIGDQITVTVGSPGGGGFDAAEFMVEGIHEQARPLNANYDDVTLSLDLSPRTYMNSLSMFPEYT